MPSAQKSSHMLFHQKIIIRNARNKLTHNHFQCNLLYCPMFNGLISALSDSILFELWKNGLWSIADGTKIFSSCRTRQCCLCFGLFVQLLFFVGCVGLVAVTDFDLVSSWFLVRFKILNHFFGLNFCIATSKRSRKKLLATHKNSTNSISIPSRFNSECVFRYLSGVRKWAHEEIEKRANYFHLAAWGAPALPAIIVLITQKVGFKKGRQNVVIKHWIKKPRYAKSAQ